MRTEDWAGEQLRVFHVFDGDALSVRQSPTGSVGTLFSGSGFEMVWVAKQDELIDPDWFSQPVADLLLVLRGSLRVEFEQRGLDFLVLSPGDLLVLPPNIRCRAYRWPRENREATIFVAAYPKQSTDASDAGAHTYGHSTSS